MGNKKYFYILLFCCLFFLPSIFSDTYFVTLVWNPPTTRIDGSPLNEDEIDRYIIRAERLSDRKEFFFGTRETYFVHRRPPQAFVIRVACQDIYDRVSDWSERIFYIP